MSSKEPRLLGLLFILGALGLLFGFLADQFLTGDQRRLLRDESDFLNRDASGGGEDPLLSQDAHAPSFEELWSSLDEEETLNAEERRLAEEGADLLYEWGETDSIRRVAWKYLGDPELAVLIYEANPELAADRPILPGQRIVIPLRYRRP